MSLAAPFSIRIFLPSGDPEGLRLVEKSNWTGLGLTFPRSKFSEARKRSELDQTGIYVLVGPREGGELPTVYIGEGDVVRRRLEKHYGKKDFWTRAVVFVSKDGYLNKAHVSFLESRLLARAQQAKRCKLDNATGSQPPSLSEADQADAEGFLADMLSIFPVLGVNVFDMPRKAKPHDASRLTLRAKGVVARGYESEEGFVVLEGSEIVTSEVKSIHQYLSDMRKELAEEGVITTDGQPWKLAQDYPFNSPSTAAGVVLGRSANGRKEWKDAAGRTLRQIQEEEAS